MKRLAVTAGILVLAGAGVAQDVEVVNLGDFVIRSGEPVVAATPEKEDDGEKEKVKETEREKRLKKLKFDRRRSVILEAWSTPPKPPEEEEKEEEAEAAAVEATETEPAPEPEATEEPEAAPEEAEEKTEEELEAEAKAAEKAAKEAEKEAKKKAEEAEKKALEEELERFQRNVTLGLWDEIDEYLDGLTENEAKAGYSQLLKSLVAGPPKPQNQFKNWAEKNFYTPEDVLGLAAAAPPELEDTDLNNLGTILRHCVDGGSLVERCISGFLAALDGGDFALERLEVARVVIGAGFPIETGEFLPEPDEAISSNERAALNLLARHYLALHAEEEKAGHLERAWEVTQAALADGEVEDDDKKEALKRAVDIAPKIREELGQSWLDESFTARPQRGMEILSVIGSLVSKGMVEQARDADQRLKSLELQTTAADALLNAAPELADEWRDTVNLLATNWLTEAQYAYTNDTSTTRGPSMQRDPFGNFYYYNYRSSSRSNMPLAISTGEMLDIRPSNTWLGLVSEGLRPKFDMVTAQLLLKVSEETEAFPYIESLAQSHPERGKELVDEFLRVWARNHNPNSNNSRTSSYMFIYGFEQRANAIPLTRSKQERNLVELSEWVARLKALPVEIDEELIATAFTSAHSAAEVYRVETIEQVFGPMEELEPKTLAELVQKMRSNLVGVWREPNTQKEANTRRRQKDIQNEVLRGYQVAADVVDGGLKRHPDDWALVLARASVRHDENNYRQEIEKDTEFASRREIAFGDFAEAAALYRDQVDGLEEEEEDAKVYLTWFYASLGACDLNAIDHEKQPVQAQIERIREAIEELPGEAAERHMAMFANALFTRMSSVNPAVKFRYVRTGLDIVGDHERAREARDVFEYYNDLVTEIRLETVIDGAARVGHGEPFGLFVNLRHTREIEREAGGFSKYLINQNNQTYAWNYGRPTENYRDKFEEAAREALDEHFEVHSITFNHPEAHSIALEEYGWRVTPYAYVLLKPRGPEVDRVPSLRLDLDFLDTTGYAILPAESPALAIDATATEAAERVFEDLQVTQTLDERQADDGKLILEVKATAKGLVPRLSTVLDLDPENFEVVATDDQGVSVTKFDEEGDGTSIVSERIWMVSMEADPELEELPDEFAFASAVDDDVEMEYQRYVDADLESVEPVVALKASYGERNLARIFGWVAAGAFVIAIGVFGLAFLRRSRGEHGPAGRFQVPETVSPFTVIGLLRDIEANNGVSEAEREELQRHIADLEGHYFEDDRREAPDLERLARDWVQRVS